MTGGAVPETVYCGRWNTILAAPIDPISEPVARRRFEKGPWFSAVLVGAGGAPRAVVELQPGAEAVKVCRLTPALSIDLVVSFTRLDGRLFASQLVAYTYADEAHHQYSDSTAHETFAFKPDGVVRRIHNDKAQPTIAVEDRDGVDVSRHWLPVPAFGDWEPLARWGDS